jgi:hypothetical protein
MRPVSFSYAQAFDRVVWDCFIHLTRVPKLRSPWAILSR